MTTTETKSPKELAQIAKSFEAALRAAHNQSKAELNVAKQTTHPCVVLGFEGWKVRYSWTINKYNGFRIPHFHVTGPTGKTAHASTGRFKELAQKCVRAGNGVPVDTIFVTYFF